MTDQSQNESKQVNAIGQPCVLIECPHCGYSEKAGIGPTLMIGGEFDVTLKSVSCSKCDYDGPPSTCTCGPEEACSECPSEKFRGEIDA